MIRSHDLTACARANRCVYTQSIVSVVRMIIINNNISIIIIIIIIITIVSNKC